VLPFTSLSEAHLLLEKEAVEGDEIKTLMEGTSQELHKGWVHRGASDFSVEGGNVICRTIVDGPNEDLDRLATILIGAISSAKHRVSIMTLVLTLARDYFRIADRGSTRCRGRGYFAI
jgi:hypothetical protein